jgi:hypothetical protein
MTMNPWLRRAGVVLWPAFMAAGVLEIAVFALVDPEALHMPGGAPLELSRTAVYSLAFFAFWAATAGAAAVALWLASGGSEAPLRPR